MGGRLGVSFAAGFVSVVLPCVLPLVPGYLAALSSVEAGQLGQRGTARRVVVSSLPFILGFTVVFVVLGAGAAAIGSVALGNGQYAARGLRARRAGPCVHGSPARCRSGWWRPGCLSARAGAARVRCSAGRSPSAPRRASAPSSPPYSSSRATTGTVLKGTVLLAAYALGLAAAFLLAGLAFARAMGAFRWLRDRYTLIQVASGVVLVALGLLLFFHREWWLQVAVNRLLIDLGLAKP